jgi:hypothetical protein
MVRRDDRVDDASLQRGRGVVLLAACDPLDGVVGAGEA